MGWCSAGTARLALACRRAVLGLPGLCLQFAHHGGCQGWAPSDLSLLA